jgi:hypothetical protein
MKRFNLVVLVMLSVSLTASAEELGKSESVPKIVSTDDHPPALKKLLTKAEADNLVRREKERFWRVWRTLEEFKLDLKNQKRRLEAKKRQRATLTRKVRAGLSALAEAPTNEYVIEGIPFSAISVQRAVSLEADNLIAIDSEIRTLETSIGNQSVLISDLEVKLAESERQQLSLNQRIKALQMEHSLAAILRRLAEIGHGLDTFRDKELVEYARTLEISTHEDLKKAGFQIGSLVPLEKLPSANSGSFVQEKLTALEAAGISIGPISGDK